MIRFELSVEQMNALTLSLGPFPVTSPKTWAERLIEDDAPQVKDD